MSAKSWIVVFGVGLVAALIMWLLWPRGLGPRSAVVGALPPIPTAALDLESRRAPDTHAIRPMPSAVATESGPTTVGGQTDDALAAATVQVNWGEDHAPALGVVVHVTETAARTGVWKTRTATTSDNGSVRVTDIVPGGVNFYVDRGGRGSLDLQPGDDKKITIEIPPGATIFGVVVDPGDTPVAGADVWLSRYGNPAEGAVVARTDPRGEFKLRSVGSGYWLAARSRDYAQSALAQLSAGKPGEEARVRIQLGGPAGSVRGVVTRSDGSPVESVRVRAANPPITAETDATGAFAIDSVPTGNVRVSARHPGLAPWSEAVEVKPHEATPVAIRMEREAAVVGTVRIKSGAPAAGASVTSGAKLGPFLFSSTTAAADGSFRLGSLKPGRFEITARLREMGEATAVLDCAEGEEVRWAAVLDSGPVILGIVIDDQQHPLEGWSVQARSSSEAPTWLAYAVTDATGRFRVTNCPKEGKIRLEIVDRKAAPGTNLRAAIDDVTPGDTEIVVHVSAKALGMIRGRVVALDGTPASATIRLDPPRETSTVSVETNSETGAFAAGPLLPDRWRVIVERKPLGSLDLGDRELVPGATLDLGDITLPPTGTLVIDLSASGFSPELTMCELCQVLPPREGRPGLWSGSLTARHPDLPRPLAIGPGTYRLVLTTADHKLEAERFQIESGREARVAPKPK